MAHRDPIFEGKSFPQLSLNLKNLLFDFCPKIYLSQDPLPFPTVLLKKGSLHLWNQLRSHFFITS